MRFKRESDSHTYAILWWSASLLLYAWLVYYGYSKIKDIASMEFFTQSKADYMLPEEMFESLPDVMFCTRGGRVRLRNVYDDFRMIKGVNYNYSELNLTTKAELDASPCDGGDDLLTIFSLKNAPSNDIYVPDLSFVICPRNWTGPGNYSEWGASVYVIPGRANPYTRPDRLLHPVDWPPGLNLNYYYVHQGRAIVVIHVEPTSTRVIRYDIWGLFGASEAELEYSLRSSSNARSFNSTCTSISVIISDISHNDTQILVTTIPGAFADWGGAFSAAWAVFYLFFGAPRLDPFGVISRLIIRKTRRCVTTLYGHWSWLATPKNPIVQCTVTSQRSSLHEKTAEDVHGTSSQESSSTSSAALDTADAGERGQQGKNCIEEQVEQAPNVKELKADLDNLQADFRRLHDLLKDYYLEMDLTETETKTDDRRWHRLFWPHKSRAGDDKNNPAMPLEDTTNQA